MGVIFRPEVPAKGCSRCTTKPSDQPPGQWCRNCMWTDQQNCPEVESNARLLAEEVLEGELVDLVFDTDSLGGGSL